MPVWDPPSEVELTRAQKLANRRWSEQVNLLANFIHGLAIGTIGFGFLRYAFDAQAVWPSNRMFAIALASRLVAEVAAAYILSSLKAES